MNNESIYGQFYRFISEVPKKKATNGEYSIKYESFETKFKINNDLYTTKDQIILYSFETHEGLANMPNNNNINNALRRPVLFCAGNIQLYELSEYIYKTTDQKKSLTIFEKSSNNTKEAKLEPKYEYVFEAPSLFNCVIHGSSDPTYYAVFLAQSLFFKGVGDSLAKTDSDQSGMSLYSSKNE